MRPPIQAYRGVYDGDDGFFPEVWRRPERSAQLSPENAPQRVLFEFALVIGTMLVLALAANVLIPGA
ncbi:MAG: hypothetical protein WCA81_08980 [Rhizomicrobium sp.]